MRTLSLRLFQKYKFPKKQDGNLNLDNLIVFRIKALNPSCMLSYKIGEKTVSEKAYMRDLAQE